MVDGGADRWRAERGRGRWSVPESGENACLVDMPRCSSLNFTAKGCESEPRDAAPRRPRNRAPGGGTSAGRHQHISRLHLLHRGQQLAVGDGERNVVVLAMIAERARHAAAAGIQVHDLSPRESAKAAPRWPAAAPSISDGSARAAGCARARLLQRQIQAAGEFLEQLQASATTCAFRCSSPRSSDGASSFTAERQLGSQNRIFSPRSAIGKQPVDH